MNPRSSLICIFFYYTPLREEKKYSPKTLHVITEYIFFFSTLIRAITMFLLLLMLSICQGRKWMMVGELWIFTLHKYKHLLGYI
jgi:hypothetical protein